MTNIRRNPICQPVRAHSFINQSAPPQPSQHTIKDMPLNVIMEANSVKWWALANLKTRSCINHYKSTTKSTIIYTPTCRINHQFYLDYFWQKDHGILIKTRLGVCSQDSVCEIILANVSMLIIVSLSMLWAIGSILACIKDNLISTKYSWGRWECHRFCRHLVINQSIAKTDILVWWWL